MNIPIKSSDRALRAAVLIAAALIATATAAPAAPVEKKLPMTFETSLTPGAAHAFSFGIYSGPEAAATKLWGEGPVTLRVGSDRTVTHELGRLHSLGTLDFSRQLWVQVSGGGKSYRVKLPIAAYALWAADGVAGPPGEPGSLPELLCPEGRYLAGIDAAGAAVCRPPDFFSLGALNGHEYYVSRYPMQFADAVRLCSLLPCGYPATVHSAEENEFARAAARRVSGAVYLGLTDENLDGTWEWGSGEAVSFTDWNPAGPGSNRKAIVICTPVGCAWYGAGSSSSGGNPYVCCETGPAIAPPGPELVLNGLNGPGRLVIDGGTIFFADNTDATGAHSYSSLMRFDRASAGNWVRSAAVDDAALYFVEYNSRDVRRYDFAGGTLSTLLGGNPAEASLFIDALNVYLTLNGSILRLPKTGGAPATLVASDRARGFRSDGAFVYYTEDGSIKSVPVAGGAPATLAAYTGRLTDLVLDGGTLVWSEEDLAADNGRIMQVALPAP